MHAHIRGQSPHELMLLATIVLAFVGVVAIIILALTHPNGFFSFIWG